MSAVLFFIAGLLAIAGALGVVMLRDPFFSVLSLVVHLVALAMLFLLLRAEFVAAVQVVIYAGAVMVLYVFVVAYVGDQQPLGDQLRGGGPVGTGLRRPAAVFGGALLVELFIAVLGTGLKGIDTQGAGYRPHPPAGQAAFGTPADIGNQLLTKFLLAFEVASILLLIAAVGAVVLARRRAGIDGADEGLAPLGLQRPRGTGTIAEAVGGLAFAASQLPPDQREGAPQQAALGAGAAPVPPLRDEPRPPETGEGGW